MPLNPGIILSIIREECQSIEERYNGYNEEFVDLLTKIIEAERRHLARPTDIQKKITRMCEDAGDLLVESRNPSPVTHEDEL